MLLYVLLYAAREPRKRAEQLRVTPNDERVRAPRSDFETIETKSMTRENGVYDHSHALGRGMCRAGPLDLTRQKV